MKVSLEQIALERIKYSPLNSFIGIRTFHGNEQDRNLNSVPQDEKVFNRTRGRQGNKVHSGFPDVESISL